MTKKQNSVFQTDFSALPFVPKMLHFMLIFIRKVAISKPLTDSGSVKLGYDRYLCIVLGQNDFMLDFWFGRKMAKKPMWKALAQSRIKCRFTVYL